MRTASSSVFSLRSTRRRFCPACRLPHLRTNPRSMLRLCSLMACCRPDSLIALAMVCISLMPCVNMMGTTGTAHRRNSSGRDSSSRCGSTSSTTKLGVGRRAGEAGVGTPAPPGFVEAAPPRAAAIAAGRDPADGALTARADCTRRTAGRLAALRDAVCVPWTAAESSTLPPAA